MTDVRGRTGAATGNGAAEPIAGSGGLIRRRRGLPGGRAVIGAFLVTVAAVGLFAAYADATAGPRFRYVVAARDIAIGTRLSAADLTTVPLDLPPQQRTGAFDDPAVLEGATVIGPLSQGDLVQSSLVVGTESDVEQVSFAITADRAVGGRLLPGERIDVLVTYGTGEGSYTEAVVRDALVIQVDEDASGDLGGIATEVLTVGVPDAGGSLRIAHAVNAGEVTVVRTTAIDRSGELPDRYSSPTGTSGEPVPT